MTPARDDAVPLREYLEGLINSLSNRHDDLRAADNVALDTALASADKAVRAALDATKNEAKRTDEAMEKRLDGLNELRSGVATSAEVKALEDRMTDMRQGFDKLEAKLEGRSGGLKDWIGWVVAFVSVAVAMVGFALLLRR